MFLKKKDQKLHSCPVLLQRWNAKVKSLLHRWAMLLQQKTNHYSSGKKKVVLVLLCGVFALESTFVVVKSFQKPITFSLTAPIHFVPLQKEDRKAKPIEITGELTRVHRFCMYLDSTSHTPGGTSKVNDYFLSHPHLIDTLRYLETLYQQQLNHRSHGK